jgi:hypothetical protein
MQPHFMTVLFLASLPFAAAGGLAGADEPVKLERPSLTANDIAGVTGLNIYKYRITMKPSTKFDVVISVLDAPDAKPRILRRNAFTSKNDKDVVELLLSFLPRDNTLRGVLLSQDEEINYRIDSQDCSPTGIATIISLPLSDIRGTRKTLIPMTANVSAEHSGDSEVCLIAILADEDGKMDAMQERYPRAKVSVVFTD